MQKAPRPAGNAGLKYLGHEPQRPSQEAAFLLSHSSTAAQPSLRISGYRGPFRLGILVALAVLHFYQTRHCREFDLHSLEVAG
jgi:hypothetical protein